MNEEKAVYKFNCDCGRSGTLTGLFIAPKSHVKMLIEDKIRVHFGEVLGKHSEIFGSIDAKDIIFVSDSEEVIKIITDFELENGFNPFDYNAMDFLDDEEEEGLEGATVREIIEKRHINKLKK